MTPFADHLKTVTAFRLAKEFAEDEHPRDPAGKFSDKGAAGDMPDGAVSGDKLRRPYAYKPPTPGRYEYRSPLRPYWVGMEQGLKGPKIIDIQENGRTIITDRPISRDMVVNYDLEPTSPRDLLNVRRDFEFFSQALMEPVDPSGSEVRLQNGTALLLSDNVDPKGKDEFPYRITRLNAEGTPTGHDVYKDWDEIARTLWGLHKEIAWVKRA